MPLACGQRCARPAGAWRKALCCAAHSCLLFSFQRTHGGLFCLLLFTGPRGAGPCEAIPAVPGCARGQKHAPGYSQARTRELAPRGATRAPPGRGVCPPAGGRGTHRSQSKWAKQQNAQTRPRPRLRAPQRGPARPGRPRDVARPGVCAGRGRRPPIGRRGSPQGVVAHRGLEYRLDFSHSYRNEGAPSRRAAPWRRSRAQADTVYCW